MERMTGIDASLRSLQAAGLIRPVFSETESSFAFRHSLSHQTAYTSLLRKDREGIHKVVGHVMERSLPEQLEALAHILAEHFNVGGEKAKALHYYQVAADEARRTYAHEEAILYYDTALEIAEQIGSQPDVIKAVFLQRGRTLELSSDYHEAMANYRRMERLGQETQDLGLELAGLTRQTTLLVAPSRVSDPQAGEKLARHCLELAERAGDREAEARAHWSLLLAGIYQGRVSESIVEGEKALGLVEGLGLDELKAFILNDLSSPYLIEGKIQQATELLESAIEIWQAHDNLPMLVDSMSNLTSSLVYLGQMDRALENSSRARRVADQIGNRWAQAFSLFMVELIHAERGNMGQALATCVEQIRLGQESGFKLPEVFSRSVQGWLLAYLGDFEQALALVSQAEEASHGIGGFWSELPKCIRVFTLARMGRAEDGGLLKEAASLGPGDQWKMTSPADPYCILSRAEAALARRRFEPGIENLRKLAALENLGGFHLLMSDVYELMARLQRAAGDKAAAYQSLGQALEEAELLGSRRMLWVIHAERALWLDEDGQIEDATQERTLARVDFAYVAEHIDDKELTQTFLNSARVKELRMA